jgi:predicted amidohydrolase
LFEKGDALWSLLFNFALEYAIGMVQVNQDGLKLNGTYHILVYPDDDNVFCGSVRTIEKNKDALAVASKEIELEVNADKTKYMVMS